MTLTSPTSACKFGCGKSAGSLQLTAVCVCVCVCSCAWLCAVSCRGRRYKEDALTAAQKARPRRDVCAAMIERFKAGLPISASAMASAMPGRG